MPNEKKSAMLGDPVGATKHARGSSIIVPTVSSSSLSPSSSVDHALDELRA